MAGALTADQRRWRYRIFALTWLGYAGFYLCRNNLSVVMPLMSEDLGYTKLQFATVLSFYHLLYMLGQFVNGISADRFGPRLVVGVGLLVSILSNLLMGFASSLLLFMVLAACNGAAQSTGWPGLVKNMAGWFRYRERGVVMAWWATNYVLGGGFATIFATYWAVQSGILAAWGWRRGFWIPAIFLLPIWGSYVLLVRNSPVDAGIEDILERDAGHETGQAGQGSDYSGTDEPRRADMAAILRRVLSEPAVWVIAIMYFFLKMTRYSFLFWLPWYMIDDLGYGAAEAGYTSALYGLVGFVGVIIAGYASDKLVQSRRFPVGAVMLFGLALVCFLQPILTAWGPFYVAVWIALVGIMTYGPDTLMTGAAAQDFGGREGSGTAAGFINGVGSLGQLCSPFLVAVVVENYGWDRLFYVFVFFALIGGVLLATCWNTQTPGNSPLRGDPEPAAVM